MAICEQNYLVWCEEMAAKAALERSSLPPLLRADTVDKSYPADHVSNMETIASTSSRIPCKSVSLRRRKTSGPKSHDEIQAYHGRAGTWPRCATSSTSDTKPRPPIPKRRSSHLSTSSRDRADLRSFHRESCRLFSSMDATMTDSGYSSIYKPSSSRLASTASFSPLSMLTEDTPQRSKSLARPPLPTVMSWKSEESRRVEYSKIEEAHSGVKGLWKKILPKYCQSRRSWRRFFKGKCDGESVRRIRMPFSDEKAGG